LLIEDEKNMKKIAILLITVLVIFVGFLSGCNEQTDEKQNGNNNGNGNVGRIVFSTSSNIHLINPDGTNEVRVTEGGWPILSPDGKKIAYMDVIMGARAYSIINVDGSNKVDLNIDYCKRRWSPDSQKLLCANYSAGVFTIDSDGNNFVTLCEEKGCSIAAFSPDGEKIVYIREIVEEEEGEEYLYIMNADGTGKMKLIEDTVSVEYSPYNGLSWSPDGMKINYIDGRTLYVIDSDGTNKIQIDAASPTGGLAWSPDSKKIAYWKYSVNDLYVVNSDGTGKTLIVSADSPGNPPSWSPDGKQLVFNMGLPSNLNIYIVKADGTDMKQLISGEYPQWSPS
jgi:TolB protein